MRLSGLATALVIVFAATTVSAVDLAVWIAEPRDGTWVIGEVEIVAEILTAGTTVEVEFRVDERRVGLFTSPPYRMRVDLGDENSAHVFEVIARDPTGGEARHRVETIPVPIAREIEIELQQLYVTATRHGDRIHDLRPQDFEVVDTKEPQRLVTFERGNVPFTAVLLIDASGSMAGDKLRVALDGATSFVTGMDELDQTKIVVFSDRLLNSTPFASAGEVDTTGLATTQAIGGTALNDHLYVALKLVEQRQGRRVIILLSDGIDTHSGLAMADVAERARRSQAQIHWIRILRAGSDDANGDPAGRSSAWRTSDEYREQFKLLRRSVRRTGGSIHTVEETGQTKPVFLAILQELREQYVLGYYPTNRLNDGAWHKVTVRVARPGVEIRAAEGYIDF
jgi:Ca-activated chloride channel family protein